MPYHVEPVAFVHAARSAPEDDLWGGEQARIVLVDALQPAALAGLASFSHVEVLFLFHQVAAEKITYDARHPRNNPDWPQVGIFAQRGKNRPNRIGSTICRLLSVEGKVLTVAELDAIDGTPVLDIKPVIREFLPREATRQPAWATELMRDYWSGKP
ncbi:SAM-dependent methyltransferase [Massilia sp. CCM 8734]|uniref:SAM-dependent methyltransferase n=1 Tax=Massilia sp. CCM 8734 TaxID=2609283 RepID=UPI001422509B|nr:SAM-dependent methyltransferase [Massilia sp. CCM 8734]NHZ99525.1 tRNA (N6-threonylcarbamoyladenosine(37)-N6)-methyltransferase TrmO [Massilia sp. CCM 8734]